MDSAREIAEAIRGNPAAGLAMTKELAARGRNLSFEDHLRLTKAYYALASRSEEQHAGLASFRANGARA
jgi:enoyl-CoA hydratase/carnithine racemase